MAKIQHKPLRAGRRVSRRKFLGAASVVALTSPLILTPGKARASEQLVITSWGGNYSEAIRKLWAEPFTKETGIPATLIDNSDLAKVKAQVMSGNVEWDVFDGTGSQLMAGSKDGLWEPLDMSLFDKGDIMTAAGADYMPIYSGGGGIVWDSKRFPDGKHPVDFKGFWDAQQFPGRRGLRTRISETLEIALVADGVAPSALYPLDIERGFKALDRIKPAVKKWIETTPQSVSLVDSGEIDFSYTYFSRVRALQQSGSPIKFSFDQMVINLEYMAVIKKSKNRDAAMKFVAFCMRPDRQAALADLLVYTPNSRKGFELVSAETKAQIADAKNPNNIIVNDAWWQDHFVDLQKRFTEWIIS